MDRMMDDLVLAAEKIGTIGSPSDTGDIVVDILAGAASRRLVGEVVVFRFMQDGVPHFALGQMTDIQLRNVWLENPTIRSLARQRGSVSPISGNQDVHTGHLKVSAVFRTYDGVIEQSSLGTIPPTGTMVHVVTDQILDNLLQGLDDQIFYLGRVYGSKPKLPMWFKHFGQGRRGAGEAYHLGIFGRTGSGKSVLARMVVLGYCRHKEMGIIVLDPQGEFAKGLTRSGLTADTVSMADILSRPVLSAMRRKFLLHNLSSMALSGWDLFVQLLAEFRFFIELGIKLPEYQDIAADYTREYLTSLQKQKQRAGVAFTPAGAGNGVFELVLDFLGTRIERIYSGEAYVKRVKERISECKERMRNGNGDRLVDIWSRTASLFRTDGGRVPVEEIIDSVIMARDERPLLVVDLSVTPPGVSLSFWEDRIKPLIIEHFLKVLIERAETCYRDGKGFNTLVVIDEAHRLAPAGSIGDPRKERICRMLVDAVRTTRKYELGWLFISQTLSSLHREIVEQLRICFFGFGLLMGNEIQALKSITGNDEKALRLYLSFKDPHSAFSTSLREYPFMTVGPVSPLSFSDTPLFFTAFNSAQEFLRANGLLPQRHTG